MSSSPVSSRDHFPVDIERLRLERLKRLRAALVEFDCMGGVFFDPINIRYATDVSNMQVWGLHNPARYAFVASEGPVILFEFPSCTHLGATMRLIDEVRPAQSWVYLMAGPETLSRAESWADEITDLVREHGGGNRRLAVDRLDWIGYRALAARDITVAEGQRIAEHARHIKTPEELRAIRDAVGACERAMATMAEHLEPGISEQQLWSILHQQNIALGGEWIETRLLVSGPRTNPWYQECSERVIQSGDLVAFDTDLIGRRGYCCDISRTWLCPDARAGDEQRRIYAMAHAHLQRLLDCVRPGVTLDELSETVGDPPEGYNVYSCLAHGVGLCDEYPVAFWKHQQQLYDAPLEADMVMCIESFVGPIDGREGVKLEEQVLLTEDGVELLSSYPLEKDWL
jgi:Xaa-Pro dipeptidase